MGQRRAGILPAGETGILPVGNGARRPVNRQAGRLPYVAVARRASLLHELALAPRTHAIFSTCNCRKPCQFMLVIRFLVLVGMGILQVNIVQW
jgi:hypothetical protein